MIADNSDIAGINDSESTELVMLDVGLWNFLARVKCAIKYIYIYISLTICEFSKNISENEHHMCDVEKVCQNMIAEKTSRKTSFLIIVEN